MNTVVTFAVLGDSAASGTGDTDRNGISRGWSYYLAQGFNHPLVYANLSRPGAQSNEVLEDQLPKALVLQPTLTAVIVGGNDALRNGFSPERLHQNLRLTISELKAIGSEVMLLQLHDPTQIVPLPKTLASILNRRINAVNQIIQAVANEFSVHILRTRDISGIYERNIWYIDRMHPSKFGHQVLAHNFREMLSPHWDIAPIEIEPAIVQSKKEPIMWMLKNGMPWFFKRSVDLLPAVVALIALELFNKTFRPNNLVPTMIYYPEFANQHEATMLEVREERVS